MRIIVHSNAPWAGTGYGQQTRLLCERLRADGHEPAVSCFYGLHGSILEWEGVRCYPAGYEPYGNDVLERHARHWFGGELTDGLILILVDAWVMHPARLTRANAAMWVPVDHEPVPPAVLEAVEASGCWPVAMSRFGERMLRDKGCDPLYAPHAVDTDVFAPVPRSEAREQLGLPQDRFIVGMVAANKGYPSRKGYSQAVEAFSRFRERRTDAYLYLHTEPTAALHGLDLTALLLACDVPADAAGMSDSYQQIVGPPADHIARLHNAFDVLLNPSVGEGFGIPIVEAQACGTPVIVTDHTAMNELCGAGWMVEGDRVFTDQRAWQRIPRVSAIEDALEDAYENAAGMRDGARAFAVQYDHRAVYEQHWRPALAELERRMQPVALPDPDPVAA